MRFSQCPIYPVSRLAWQAQEKPELLALTGL